MQKTKWKILFGINVLLIVLTFTPLVTTKGMYKPMMLGVPYTLWVGMLITCSIVFVTFLAIQVHPSKWEENSNDND